ncbi:alginate lyase family protein [Agrobacterium tumefaciens]|nr:alginate lyase family protein [Agrobacterium tumefaciens]NTE26796.1 alginate lyase family protein [Agrobacterium tumefaciens]
MRKLVLTILIFTSCLIGKAQIVSLSKEELNTLKAEIANNSQAKKIYESLQKSAALYLNQPPNPIDTIRTEGLLKGDPKKDKTKLALPDMNKMFALALQYQITNDRNYLNKCISFLTAWAKINHSNGDPIDDTNLDKAIEAYDLIKSDIPLTDKKPIDNWLNETARAEINSKRMKPGKATAINNWNAHRLKVVGEIGYVLNNREFIDWTIDHLKSHININLYADGSSLDFKQRDAMHYHLYDLEPMLKLAIIINRGEGTNFYTYLSPNGSSIKKSIDWLIPYIKGEKKHEEYVNTTVKFDHDRARNNEPGFAAGTLFEPKLAIPLLKSVIYFDQEYENLLNQLLNGQADMIQIIDNIKRENIK